jgi:hypothetical protein
MRITGLLHQTRLLPQTHRPGDGEVIPSKDEEVSGGDGQDRGSGAKSQSAEGAARGDERSQVSLMAYQQPRCP